MNIKGLIVLILVLLLNGCDTASVVENTLLTSEDYSYIEVVPENSVKFLEQIINDEIIMNYEEINKYNLEIFNKSNSMYDIYNVSFFSKDEILNLINSYKLPDLPKYNGTEIINLDSVGDILDNRNLSLVSDVTDMHYGIVVNRSNLRALPTDIHFYSKYAVEESDQIQETEVSVNTPVLILHESKDKLWKFVVTETYAGWVKSSDIALATLEDVEYFVNNESFLVVTDSFLDIQDVILDMGVKLPFIDTQNNMYIAIIPIKGEDGNVSKKVVSIGRSEAHIGFLPYTYRNLIVEAFKYEGVKYSWGSLGKGVDCSGFISNVYKTMGFKFPRNTSSQKDSVGEVINLSGKTKGEKLELLSLNSNSLVYQPGHVMLFLCYLNGEYYFIHASGAEMKVVVSTLSQVSSNLEKADRIIKIY